MKLHPILFSTAMVQAILAGRKTQTRRILKHELDDRGTRTTNVPFEDWHGNEVKFPYGQVGDVLWVRETWAKGGVLNEEGGPPLMRYFYRADTDWQENEWHSFEKDGPVSSPKWKPSIHMPRSACRLYLQITDIRVERLNEISEEDAISEGIEYIVTDVLRGYRDYAAEKQPGIQSAIADTPRASFRSLWESINGPESWQANPFVWVISFKRIEKPNP